MLSKGSRPQLFTLHQRRIGNNQARILTTRVMVAIVMPRAPVTVFAMSPGDMLLSPAGVHREDGVVVVVGYEMNM